MSGGKIKPSQIVHDLKVPLAVVDSCLQGLLTRTESYGPVNEKQKKVLSRALRNAQIMKTIINDLLDVARSEEGTFRKSRVQFSILILQTLVECFDLVNEVLSEKIQSCRSLAALQEYLLTIGFFLEIDQTLWFREFSLDEAIIRQILRNLLNNALRYRKNKIILQAWQEGGRLVLAVADDGKGIPIDFQEKIFENYFQIDPDESRIERGHGLGLARAKVLTENLGGSLSLDSDENKGARFSVSLPLEKE